MKYWPLFLLFCSCANVSTTKFIYTEPSGKTLSLEMPKEVNATDLKVKIDPKTGVCSIEAKKWETRNVETITAQGDRESKIAEKSVKGAVEGAIKGMKGVP